ncbi:hypothetical protein [Sutcliffiella horikoshii]|uniref:hypothetical protein n=1 Tax=Sutcliffiella horikoshii TaxID=79883 RepID=UPI00384C74CD
MSTIRDSNITGLTGNFDVVCETFAIMVKGYICVFPTFTMTLVKVFCIFQGGIGDLNNTIDSKEKQNQKLNDKRRKTNVIGSLIREKSISLVNLFCHIETLCSIDIDVGSSQPAKIIGFTNTTNHLNEPGFT